VGVLVVDPAVLVVVDVPVVGSGDVVPVIVVAGSVACAPN
jgi:hypothetical protein